MTRTRIFFFLATLLLAARNCNSFAPAVRPGLSQQVVSSSLGAGVQPPQDDDDSKKKGMSKEEMFKKVGETMRQEKLKKKKDSGTEQDDQEGVLDRLNPFKAGQNLRKTIDQTLQGLSTEGKTEQVDSLYYLNDRVFEDGADTSSLSLEDRLLQDDYVPEVLVIGATGEVGNLVVNRMLQEQGRFRVRVLVRDLYTRTLNRLGTGVTYCQGDLNNVDSLEYALTDVDKIIFCASPPKPDEDDFRLKFKDYVQETLRSTEGVVNVDEQQEESSDEAWERLDSVLQLRAEMAEQVDCIGMKNAVTAYQHVRHADYGTSQAAKRTLFKFEGRPQDFNLFSVDQTSDDDGLLSEGGNIDSYYEDMEDLDEFDNYDDYSDDNDYDDRGLGAVETRRDGKVQTQVQWLRNKFGHAVFVGRLPKSTPTRVGGGEAAVISSRFRSRENPDDGIDLSTQFSGLIARVCADGGVYEAFVRTGLYASDGIEYVCEFSTNTKNPGYMKSKNKFSTIRLPFENFKPVARKEGASIKAEDIPVFRGKDIQYLGFRYRSASNRLKEHLEAGDKAKFYLALSYIKLYRAQPEPEFVYVSDARIPPVVKNGMVQHQSRQLIPMGAGEESGVVQLLDDKKLKTAADRDRTEEEVYYKFRGEEILKNSGLSYTVIRVMNYNESPSGEASTIDLKASNDDVTAVSRAEVAQIAVSALMDPNALNKSFYISKRAGKATVRDEDISAKFSALPADAVA